MEITYDHIIKLCAIVADFHNENDYYPIIVAHPELIKEFCNGYLNYALQVKVKSYFDVLDFYNRHKRSNTYINKQTPEGLVIFKQVDKIITHRIFDLPDSLNDKSKKFVIQNVSGTIFKHINFDSEI